MPFFTMPNLTRDDVIDPKTPETSQPLMPVATHGQVKR